MIQIQKFTFNPFSENTFVILDDEPKEAMIIDPGCSDEYDEKTLSEFISSKELQVLYLINTHCHIDHIFGCKFVKEKYNSIFLAPEDDLPLLQNAVAQAQMFGVEIENPPMPDKFLSEDFKLTLNKSEIKFLFTPGHTPGEFCVYLENEKILISGDVLFKESIGRTDLWGGDYNTLLHSIKSKLLTLPDEVKVFPGHGEETTIGYEKNNNPFLRD